ACDQCRKSKCKCERATATEPCKACIMLGTPCTFLGPSRKRGPPKGYIDAIEARLHQTEALIGILLAADDVRAKSLLDDLREDPLAHDIIQRVDNSPYGPAGRSRAESGAGSASSKPESKTKAFLERDSASSGLSPSNEWQDTVSDRLNALAKERGQTISANDADPAPADRPTLSLVSSTTNGADGEQPRQRRRVNGPAARLAPSKADLNGKTSHLEGLESDAEDDALVSEVGQLSLNEERELRFHGKASGLHLLGVKDRVDGRNEGGIWRFPKARVWPPVPNTQQQAVEDDESSVPITLPDAAMQEALLELYFTYVHPSLPVVHKTAFLEAFRQGCVNIGTPPANASPAASPGGISKPRVFISRLLLLVMYSIAARFRSHRSGATTALSPTDGSMWPAGDEYYDTARAILGRTYAAPRVSTCQALLLMGYREVGIGAMAQAWLYIGMAIRMAHDLGLHKKANRWLHDGVSLFTKVELQERRRIWSACIVMDKYVSSYIGRPVYIHECDFDTELPSETEPEELEDWRSKPSTVIVYDPDDHEGEPLPVITIPGRVISCFNASTTLAAITGRIVHAIYAIRAGPGRHAEMLRLEEALEKWYLNLPEHLRFDPATSAQKTPLPPPHVLTLHAGYWTVVILLHRPLCVLPIFSLGSAHDPHLRAISQRNYDLCVQAANHITSIVSLYQEHYCLRRGPVFLCYYIFTAAIMHVITLNAYPDDPQARRGLTSCMHVLRLLDTVWPSALRAWELLHGSKVNVTLNGSDASSLEPSPPAPAPATTSASRQKDRLHKRSAETFLTDDARFFPSASVSSGPRLSYAQSGGHTPSFYASPPSYERWGSSDQPFSDSLSTSGLPQQYSTGFIDRLPPLSTPAQSAGQGTSAARYPQYWNDYAALNPLGVPYGGQDRHQQPQGNAPQSLFGMQEHQYHMYSASGRPLPV
ncbi:fungal-specific transcription factor domain-containing protein, partial [Vararia minispora EC-137]